MPANEARTIPVFEVTDVVSEGRAVGGDRPVYARGDRARMVRVVETSVEVLQQNMTAFIDGVSAMLAEGARVAGGYEVDTVEVQCQVSGSGTVGFAGTGVGIEGGSTLTITFKKRP
jgi:hypothetical protein